MASTRFIEMVEGAGMLDDEPQRQRIADLVREYEADTYVRVGLRARDGSVHIKLLRDGEVVCQARVGLDAEVETDVTERVA
jgi:hypothetical protein